MLDRAPRVRVCADAAQAGPTLPFHVRGDPTVGQLSRLKRMSLGVVRILSASFMTSSMTLCALCKIFVLAQF